MVHQAASQWSSECRLVTLSPVRSLVFLMNERTNVPSTLAEQLYRVAPGLTGCAGHRNNDHSSLPPLHFVGRSICSRWSNGCARQINVRNLKKKHEDQESRRTCSSAADGLCRRSLTYCSSLSVDYQIPKGDRDRKDFSVEKLQELVLHARLRRSSRDERLKTRGSGATV